MNTNIAAMVLAIATFLQTALAQDTLVPNDDGTYVVGVDSDCGYGCTVNGVCGTKNECASAAGGVTLLIVIVILVIAAGCCNHHKHRWSGGHHGHH